jgi:hypothetical protein
MMLMMMTWAIMWNITGTLPAAGVIFVVTFFAVCTHTFGANLSKSTPTAVYDLPTFCGTEARRCPAARTILHQCQT